MTALEMARAAMTPAEIAALCRCSPRQAAKIHAAGRAALARLTTSPAAVRREDPRCRETAGRALSSHYPRLMRSLEAHGRGGVPSREFSRAQ
jgi:hypothetical protein